MEDFLKAFDKIIGYDEIKKRLMPICDMFHNLDKYNKFGVIMPSGVVLEGDPGYGKTLMAKCFIEACEAPYFVCRKDKADGDFVNYMRKCFDDAAENAPAIVFLDDMDKFANEDEDHKDAEEYVAVQACIDNVKGKNVFVIATTNNADKLPDSLLRAGRFDAQFHMDGLEREDQIKLIQHFMKNKPISNDLSFENIWHILGDCVSCAELEKILNDAAIKVAFENKNAIEKEDIVAACLRHHFTYVDTEVDGATYKDKLVAYHEAGHAVVAEILEPNSVGLVSIQAYHGANAGVTSYVLGDFSEKTYSFREHRATALLAGKAATEIALNEKDIGSWMDIRGARRIIEDFRDYATLYGFECRYEYGISQEQLARADRALNTELDRLYAEAKRIIFEHRDFLDAIANALLEKKTIFAVDIQAIKQNLGLAQIRD